MMLIVTGVGSLIVAYSIGYMDGSDEERRFFAYMSLFVFSMLLLVQGGNLLLLLAGWGMVGLSSYLLIGYDQHRASAIAAAKKAFIMNAAGDATMALALFLLIQQTGRLDYQKLLVSQEWDAAYVRAQHACLAQGLQMVSTQDAAHSFTVQRPTGEQITVVVQPGLSPRAVSFTGTPAHDVSDVVRAYQQQRY